MTHYGGLTQWTGLLHWPLLNFTATIVGSMVSCHTGWMPWLRKLIFSLHLTKTWIDWVNTWLKPGKILAKTVTKSVHGSKPLGGSAHLMLTNGTSSHMKWCYILREWVHARWPLHSVEGLTDTLQEFHKEGTRQMSYIMNTIITERSFSKRNLENNAYVGCTSDSSGAVYFL